MHAPLPRFPIEASLLQHIAKRHSSVQLTILRDNMQVSASLYSQAIGYAIVLAADKCAEVSVCGEPVDMMLRRLRGVLSETLIDASFNASFALARVPEAEDEIVQLSSIA